MRHVVDDRHRGSAAISVGAIALNVLPTMSIHMLRQLYYGVRTLLGTDGPGVMGTSRVGEYETAKEIIAEFCSGRSPIVIAGREVKYADLTPTQQKRFSMEHIQQMEDAHHAEVVADDVHDVARKKEQP